MGSLAQSYFCENGHLVIDVPHHHIIDDEDIECPHCGSSNIRRVFEWHDPDYWEDGDVDTVVSHKPIDFEPHVIQVPIYNVKRLFKERK